MAAVSFLGYFRLKIMITLLRISTMYKAREPLRRDAELAHANYPVSQERLLIPSRDAGRNIVADLYLPPTSAASCPPADQAPLPVLVNWHGSGFCLTGLLGSNVLFAARVAHELQINVLDVDYRKAPEHPFPAATTTSRTPSAGSGQRRTGTVLTRPESRSPASARAGRWLW